MEITTKQGSATSPKPTREHGIIIAHLCNNVGKWGAGFVLAVNDVSKAPFYAYKALCNEFDDEVQLGTTQFVEARPNLFVANMIAQRGVDRDAVADGCLVDYASFAECLQTVFPRAIGMQCHVHIPSGIGSGLAGGDQQIIHDLIETNAKAPAIKRLEDKMEFIPTITLWEFQDTTAKSFVKPTKQTMVQSVFGSPDDSDPMNIDDILNDL